MTRDMLLSLLASFQAVQAMTGIDSAKDTGDALQSIINGALDAMDATTGERLDVQDAGADYFFSRMATLDVVPF